MRPADIVLQNDSKQEVRLIHTSLANAGKTSAYHGTPSCWKTPPPNAGLRITPGNSSKAGTMDSVMLCDSSSWIFVQYQGSKTILQVFVAMKASGFFSSRGSGIWADIHRTVQSPIDREQPDATRKADGVNCLLAVRETELLGYGAYPAHRILDLSSSSACYFIQERHGKFSIVPQ